MGYESYDYDSLAPGPVARKSKGPVPSCLLQNVDEELQAVTLSCGSLNMYRRSRLAASLVDPTGRPLKVRNIIKLDTVLTN